MMSRHFKLLLTIVILSALTMACGKDKKGGGTNNNVQCDAYGYCYDTGYSGDPYNPQGYYPFGHNPRTTVALGGMLQITNPGAWKQALDGMQNCNQRMIFFTVSTCGLASRGNPYVEVVIHDYKFDQGGSSTGSVSLINRNVNMAPQMYYTTWKKLSNPEGFQSRATALYTYGQASQLTFTVVGKPTDSHVQIKVSYGGTQVGQGTLLRLRP